MFGYAKRVVSTATALHSFMLMLWNLRCPRREMATAIMATIRGPMWALHLPASACLGNLVALCAPGLPNREFVAHRNSVRAPSTMHI